MSRIIRVSLTNGFSILLCPDTDAQNVGLTLGVKVGYFDEPPDVLGISHLVEHLFCCKAKASMEELSTSPAWIIAGSTIYNHTCYSSVVPRGDLFLAIQVLSDAYWMQTVDCDRLERELRVILHEAARKADSSRDSIIEHLYGQLFPEHPIGRWRVGSPRSLGLLSAESVRAFRQQYYRPENSVLAITGPFNPDVVLKVVERSFGVPRSQGARSIRHTASIANGAPRTLRLRKHRRDIAVSRFAVGWKTPGEDSREAPLFELVSALVEQDVDLQQLEARRCGWNTEVRHYIPGGVGVLLARGDTFPHCLASTIRTVCRAAERSVEQAPSRAALSTAKRAVAHSWATALAAPGPRARLMAEWELLAGCRRAQSDFAHAMSATPSSVQGVASCWLGQDKRAICIHVPHKYARSQTVWSLPERLRAEQKTEHQAPFAVEKRRMVVDRTLNKHAALLRTVSGSPVLVTPMDTHDGLVSIGLYVRGGKSDESHAVSGITRALVRGMARSNWLDGRVRWRKLAAEIGFSLNPVVGLDYFGWSASVEPRHLENAMQLLRVFVTESSISEAGLERFQFQALSSLGAAYESAARTSLSLALRAAYGDHTYGLPDEGLATSIANLTVASLSKWRDERVRVPGVAVAILGPADAAALCKIDFDIEAETGIVAPVSAPPWPDQPHTVVEGRSWHEGGLSVLFPLGGVSSVPTPLHDVIAILTGGPRSRLVTSLRFHKAMCYVATGLYRIRASTGAIGFYAETASADLVECREAIVTEFRNLARGGFAESELQIAKQEVLNHWTAGAAGALEMRKKQLLLNWFYRNLESYAQYPEYLAELSLESVLQVIRHWSSPASPAVTGIVGAGS